MAGFYQPPDDTKVKADRVTITTDRVYGEATAEEPPKRRARTRRDEKPADEKPEGDAAAESKEAADGKDAEEGNEPGEVKGEAAKDAE